MALIPDDPKQRNALVLAILSMAAVYFFWTFWYSPRNTEVEEMTARLEALDAENNRAQIIATRGGTELQDRLALYETHVSRLEALIPQREEVPALLNDITAESRRAGVEIASLTPASDEVGAFYTKDPYDIEVIGDFHDIGRFLTNIASLPRIITPVNLDVSAFRGDATVLSPEFETPLTARLQIQTYILPEASGPATAPGGEGQEGT